MKGQEIANLLNKIADDAANRLLAGVFSKNVKLHLLGLGLTEEMAERTLDIAESKANKMSHYKIGKYAKEIRYKR